VKDHTLVLSETEVRAAFRAVELALDANESRNVLSPKSATSMKRLREKLLRLFLSGE
jgi:hypothetical protein